MANKDYMDSLGGEAWVRGFDEALQRIMGNPDNLVKLTELSQTRYNAEVLRELEVKLERLEDWGDSLDPFDWQGNQDYLTQHRLLVKQIKDEELRINGGNNED